MSKASTKVTQEAARGRRGVPRRRAGGERIYNVPRLFAPDRVCDSKGCEISVSDTADKKPEIHG